MKKYWSLLALALLIVTVSIMAQQGYGPRRGAGNGPAARDAGWGRCLGQGPSVSPESMSEISGTVTAINAGLGQPQPTLMLDGATSLLIGPNRVWADHSFPLAVGDFVTVIYFPHPQDESLLVAVKISKGDDSITLRDDSGRPVRAGGRRGNCRLRD